MVGNLVQWTQDIYLNPQRVNMISREESTIFIRFNREETRRMNFPNVQESEVRFNQLIREINQSDQIDNLVNQIEQLRNTLTDLQEQVNSQGELLRIQQSQISWLDDAIRYMPGGQAYQEAFQDFQNRASVLDNMDRISPV